VTALIWGRCSRQCVGHTIYFESVRLFLAVTAQHLRAEVDTPAGARSWELLRKALVGCCVQRHLCAASIPEFLTYLPVQHAYECVMSEPLNGAAQASSCLEDWLVDDAQQQCGELARAVCGKLLNT
jgi:hypothetical protein